jgi:chromosome segregation protein
MYLKKIEVQGFKSFANKIVFQFHNGITGIVGPNGSGKSNVADAVRWVLGEQSAKSLRGSSMQDVIFAGTETRKPLGYAYVAITLDNSDHILPIDYSEVTVARRVYRSGESEYLINGTSCRLKDVNELFYDTGIGKEGYSIIGQGQIDKILSGKPEERRELFDEAVGIVKFKRRKRTAEKKLEDERQNLVRVNDILSELTKQLAPMERQAETAKIYLKKKEELKTYDVNMFLMEMERIRGDLKEAEKKLEISTNEMEETKAAHENTKLEYEKLEIQLEELDARISEMRDQAAENQIRKQQMEGQINVLKEQINTAKLNDEHLQNRIYAIGRDMETKQQQKQQEEEELQKLKTELQMTEAAEEDFRLESEALQASLSHLEREIEKGKNAIISVLNQRASTKGKLQRYDTMLEQLQIRRAEISQKILLLKSQESEQTDVLGEQQQKLQEITARIEQLLAECSRYEEKVNTIQQKLIAQNKNVETGQTAYHREASRLETLKNITERYDGYGNSIRRVMEQKGKEKGLLGVVADLIKVEKTYETAIETALGGSIQNIVTEDEHTAKRMIEFLKRNKYGRATFLPLTSIGNRNTFTNEKALHEPGVIGLASDLVKAEKKYEGLVKYLLGRTVVTDHIDHAIALNRKYQYSLRIVTLEGESLNPGGSMTGGAFKNSSNLLGRRREMEELAASVALLKKDLDMLRTEIDANRRTRSEYRERIVGLNEKLQEQYLLQNTVKVEISQIKSRKEETHKSFGQLKAESLDIEEQSAQIEKEQQSIAVEMEESLQTEKRLEEEIKKLQKQQETERREQDSQSSQSEAIHLKLQEVRQKAAFIRQNIERIRNEMSVLQEEKSGVEEGIRTGSAEIERKLEDIEKIRKDIEAAIETEQESADEQKRLLADRENLNVSHKSFFSRREELSEKISLLDKENFRLNAQKEKLEEAKDSQINYMWEEYGLGPGSAADLREEEYQDPVQMKKAIQTLKSEIKALGNVNVNAIEDFKELSERHSFLSSQHDDLVKSENALMEIIDELDEGMRAQFKERFALIQIEFDKAFKQLFGGGKGSLELVEDEDILDAGIRIISQPPGKKLQNMMQMSGGEKALTAIALLFAIQNLKPSPFCLLDEIEAALDESNVTRYASYLKKLTKNTQFIIITHRRGTMAAADRLYGITMQEKGVSALVSVNLLEDDLE